MNSNVMGAGNRRQLYWVVGDVLVAALLAFCTSVFALRTILYDRSELFRTPARALPVYAVMLVAGIAALRFMHRGSVQLRLVVRLVVYGLTATLLVAVGCRQESLFPRKMNVRDDGVEPNFVKFDADDRAKWGLRVARHKWAEMPEDSSFLSTLSIPEAWPFPEDVEIALTRGANGGRRMYARIVGAERVCVDFWSAEVPYSAGSNDELACGHRDANAHDLHFFRPTRVPWRSRLPAAIGEVGQWLQYRLDAMRTARTTAPEGEGWEARLEAGARASVSVVGGTVFVGTHGAGSLEAFDLATGMVHWRVRLANWVHQDAVSDGRTVVVGFGDNRLSVSGEAPAGVSAYEVHTGRLLWTQFESNSVMTSPVITGNRVTYVTASGVLRVRRLADGSLRGTFRLPGHVMMAPPVARHDTLVVSLDEDQVCAVDLKHVELLWCQMVPEFTMMGHSAASLFGDTVLVSGLSTQRPHAFRWLLPHLYGWDPVDMVIRFSHYGVAGQRIAALDLRTGRNLWRTGIFQATRKITGHNSGTPAGNERVIVVNLPVADLLVALDRRTFDVSWTRESGGSRGAVLLVDNRVYLSTVNGSLRVYDASDGTLRCSINVPRHFDRAGPTLAGERLIFATLEGDVIAFRRRDLDACDSRAVLAAFARRR